METKRDYAKIISKLSKEISEGRRRHAATIEEKDKQITMLTNKLIEKVEANDKNIELFIERTDKLENKIKELESYSK